MNEIEAIKELNTYVSDEHKLTLSRECIDLARKALEKQISLERILERLEERKGTCNGHKCEKDGCAGCVDCKIENAFTDAIKIVKEEGGIE